MNTALLGTPEECLSWMNQELLLLGGQIHDLERDLDDGIVVLVLLKSWGVSDVTAFYKRKGGAIAEAEAVENRKMVCGVLNKQGGKFGIRTVFTKQAVFRELLLDAVRTLYIIRQSIARDAQRVPHVYMSATRTIRLPLDFTIKKPPAINYNSKYADEKTEWKLVQQSRVLRIYYSSTFEDMHKERTEIFNIAEKRMKHLASRKGVELILIDLRRGNSGDVSDNGLSLHDCLSAVDNCAYFVCVMGARYGHSINLQNAAEWDEDAHAAYPYIREAPGLSAVDYEVTHASLKDNPIARRSFFYSRDENYATKHLAESRKESELYQSSSKKNGKKQESMKSKIRACFEIQPYNTPAELGEMLIESIVRAMDADFPDILPTDSNENAHDQLFGRFSIQSKQRSDIVHEIHARISEQRRNGLCETISLRGEPGGGKSTIMGGLASHLMEKEGAYSVVMYHFTGCSPLSRRTENLCKRVVHALFKNKILPFSPDSKEGLEYIGAGLGHILRTASQRTRKLIVLLIDGLDEFKDSAGNSDVHQLEWLPKKTPKNVSIVVSLSDRYESNQIESSALSKLLNIRLPRFNGSEIVQMATDFLQQCNRTIDQQRLGTIIEKQQITGNPLYLRSILSEVRSLGNDGITVEEFESICSAENLAEAFNIILDRWEKRYGIDTVRISASALLVSRIGLSESELENYVEFRMKKNKDLFYHSKCINSKKKKKSTFLTFAARILINGKYRTRFLFVLTDYLTVSNGRYFASHGAFLRTIQERYFNHPQAMADEKREYALWLIYHHGMQTKEMDIIAEISHALCSSGEDAILMDYLKIDHVIECLLEGEYRDEFKRFWGELNKKGYDHKAVYQEKAQQNTPVGTKLVSYFCECGENEYTISVVENRLSQNKTQEQNFKDYEALGKAYENTGKYQQALEQYQKALKIKHEKYGEHHDSVAETHVDIGRVYEKTRQYNEAVKTHLKALDTHVRLHGEDSSTIVELYNIIASDFNLTRKYEDALIYFQKSIELQEKLYGDDHPPLSDTYSNVGALSISLKRDMSAVESFQKSLAIKIRDLGEYHPNIAASYMGIGNIYRKHEKNQEALHYFLKSARVQVSIYGEENQRIANSYNNIGTLYQEIGRFDDALRYHEMALQIRKRLFGMKHASVAKSYNNIGVAYDSLARYEEALKSHEIALEIQQEIFGDGNQEIGITFYNIGILMEKQNRIAEAINMYSKAREIEAKHLGARHSRTMDTDQNLARVQALLAGNP